MDDMTGAMFLQVGIGAITAVVTWFIASRFKDIDGAIKAKIITAVAFLLCAPIYFYFDEKSLALAVFGGILASGTVNGLTKTPKAEAPVEEETVEKK